MEVAYRLVSFFYENSFQINVFNLDFYYSTHIFNTIEVWALDIGQEVHEKSRPGSVAEPFH